MNSERLNEAVKAAPQLTVILDRLQNRVKGIYNATSEIEMSMDRLAGPVPPSVAPDGPSSHSDSTAMLELINRSIDMLSEIENRMINLSDRFSKIV